MCCASDSGEDHSAEERKSSAGEDHSIDRAENTDIVNKPYPLITIHGHIGEIACENGEAGQRVQVPGIETHLTLPISYIPIDSSLSTKIALDTKLDEVVEDTLDTDNTHYDAEIVLDKTASRIHQQEEQIPESNNGDPWLVEDPKTHHLTPHFPGTTTLHCSSQIRLKQNMGDVLYSAVSDLFCKPASGKKYEIEIPIIVYKVD